MTDIPDNTSPPGYRLAYTLVVTTRRNMIWLNVISVLIFVMAGALVFGCLLLYAALGSPLQLSGWPTNLPVWVGLVTLLALLLVHEWLHGLAIQAMGYKPRYGAKPLKLVFYATADGVYFTRRQFIIVALTPLVVISAIGLFLALFVPQQSALWLGLLVTVNAASAIGDLWMTRVALRYPPEALVQDHEDGMSVFLPMQG